MYHQASRAARNVRIIARVRRLGQEPSSHREIPPCEIVSYVQGVASMQAPGSGDAVVRGASPHPSIAMGDMGNMLADFQQAFGSPVRTVKRSPIDPQGSEDCKKHKTVKAQFDTSSPIVQAWVDPLLRASCHELRRLGPQGRPLLVATACSGTGAPTLALKADCPQIVPSVVHATMQSQRPLVGHWAG